MTVPSSFRLRDPDGMHRFCIAVGLAVLCALLVFSPARLHGQSLAGIGGTVVDQAGAVVTDAKVTATNDATGVPSHAGTSSAGAYTITDLNPGTYTVKVEKPGFEISVTKNVVVETSKRTTVDVTMTPGALTTTVEVKAEAVALETNDPETGSTFESKLLEELPAEIGGGVGDRDRQIDQFLFLTPGVQGGAFEHRINGGVSFQNEVLFNGVPALQAETQGFQSNINPPYEMVSEFRVLTSTFSAQYGLAQGVASYRFASGTNTLHGDVFEILRNDFFDAKGANPPLDASGNRMTPVDKHHNYGFSVGGPIYLPKVYDGRNKTFFHTSVDWYRLNTAVNGNVSVPTPAMKTGDFSAFPQTIYIPQSGLILGCTPGAPAGSPFPGNMIPANCISATAASVLPLIPDPAPGRTGFSDNLPSQITNIPTRQTNWGFSIDHNITGRQALHGSFWRDKWNEPFCCDNGALFSNELSGLKTEPRLGTGLFLTYSNAISTQLVMTAGIGWMGEINNEFNTHPGVSFPAVQGGTVFPTITFSGQTSPTSWGAGGAGETFSINRKLGISFSNNWLYNHGRHTLNFGFEARRAFQNDHECQNCGGGFNFANATTSDGVNLDTTGSSFASFLLGDVDSASRQFAFETKLRNFYLSPYLQDDIKITPRFTLNAGLRWDILWPFATVPVKGQPADTIVFFNPNAANTSAISVANGQALPGAASLLGTCSNCVGYSRAPVDLRQFSPRLGFAYELNNKTVIMAGYALNHLTGGTYEFGNNKVAVQYGSLLAGLFNVPSNGTNVAAFGQWDNNPVPVPPATPFSPGLVNGTGSLTLFGFTKSGRAPYVQNWNFGIQRELPRNMLVTAAYVGNRGVHLPSALDAPNQLDPGFLPLGNQLGVAWTDPTSQPILQAAGFGQSGGFFTPYVNFINDYGSGATLAQALRPFPMYHTIVNDFDLTGDSRYDALQAQAQKRFTGGLSFLIAYTLSRAMTNAESGFSTFQAFGTPLNKFNKRAEWSIAGFDQTHILSVSGIYELPIGPGKPFLNHGGLLAKNLLGGWQLGGIFQYATGSPFGISASGSPLLNTLVGNRADLVPGAKIDVNWNNYYKGLPVFNIAAFTDPGRWVPGNSPRNIAALRNPFNGNENIGLGKRFFLGERVSAELRMDYFNVLNRMQVCGNGNTDTSVSDGSPSSGGTFGLDNTSTLGTFNPCQGNTPRRGQLYLKINF